MMKSTYGTGCFALLNTGDTPVTSKNRLLTTIARLHRPRRALLEPRLSRRGLWTDPQFRPQGNGPRRP